MVSFLRGSGSCSANLSKRVTSVAHLHFLLSSLSCHIQCHYHDSRQIKGLLFITFTLHIHLHSDFYAQYLLFLCSRFVDGRSGSERPLTIKNPWTVTAFFSSPLEKFLQFSWYYLELCCMSHRWSSFHYTDPTKFRLTHETSFVKDHTRFWTKTPVTFYCVRFIVDVTRQELWGFMLYFVVESWVVAGMFFPAIL